MLIIDNINKTVKEDLQAGIQKGSKMSVAAACFSIYAYQELKKQLEGIEELRFIFTSPTFITEKASKAQREFYIPRISRERSLYGTEFEVKLRNELTQKAIAKECADWIRHKVVFKSNVTQEQMMGFMTVDESTYMPINGFTTVDLGCERGNNAYYPVQKTESFENANYFLKLFEQLWNDKKKLQEVTDVVIENISAAYRENAPEYIYFVALYNIFKEFLDDISEDELPNEATGFKESKIWGMKNKDANGMLDDDAFYQFLNRITGFVWTYAVTNPGVNALRTPVYAEMVNIVNNRPVSFDGFKFEPATVKSMFANFTFSNTRPITKSMLAWWAFQDDLQELISLETVLEIEHISHEIVLLG